MANRGMAKWPSVRATFTRRASASTDTNKLAGSNAHSRAQPLRGKTAAKITARIRVMPMVGTVQNFTPPGKNTNTPTERAIRGKTVWL